MTNGFPQLSGIGDFVPLEREVSDIAEGISLQADEMFNGPERGRFVKLADFDGIARVPKLVPALIGYLHPKYS